MKRTIFGLMALLTASFLFCQSVADLSKQEKERREKLKGKGVKVVTNADLKSKPRKASVADPLSEGEAPPAEAPAQLPAEPAAGEGAVEGEAPPEPPEEEPARGAAANTGFARSVSSESFLVENPQLALGPPDNRFAMISISGVLDLDIEVNNGPGDDLAVYAVPPARTVPEGEKDEMLETEQAAMWYGEFGYAVLGLDDRGEWQEIGFGSGRNPDRFDLGGLKSTKTIRVMFKAYNNPYQEGAKPMRLAEQELTFGLDAVRALH